MLTYHVILPIATAIAVMIREMVQVMAEVLVGAAAVVVAEPAAEKTPITKADLMEWGLAGGAGSNQRRQALLRRKLR